VSAPAEPRRCDPIAVFDSGVGGLTVLHELLVSLPHEDFVYLGDTARFPYGDRTPTEVARFALELSGLLLERERAKLLVVACNTATSVALEPLQQGLAAAGHEIDVIGVLTPESVLAVATTHNGRIGLLATPTTVSTGAYARAVEGTDPHVRLVSIPCPDLAPLIQSGYLFDHRMVDTVRAYCAPLREAGVDTVILGCTHYPLVASMLQRTLGPRVQLISSGHAVARRVEHALAMAQLESPRKEEGDYRFLCTGEVDAFRALGSRFLQMPLGEVAPVDLAAEVAQR
jgi:glutamate racemase